MIKKSNHDAQFVSDFLQMGDVSDLARNLGNLFSTLFTAMEPHVLPENASEFAHSLILRATEIGMPIEQRNKAMELLEKVLPKVYDYDRTIQVGLGNEALCNCLSLRVDEFRSYPAPVSEEYGNKIIALINRYSEQEPLDLSFRVYDRSKTEPADAEAQRREAARNTVEFIKRRVPKDGGPKR